MAPETARIGRNTREIMEDAPAGLAAKFFEVVLNAVQTEDAATLPEIEASDDPGARLPEHHLNSLGVEMLSALELHSQRVTALADSMGAQCLGMIVSDQALTGDCQRFEEQLDEMCKSCWAFVELQAVFQNAESFHNARRDRERGNIYSVFALDLEADIPASAASIDRTALCARLGDVLGLRKSPRLTAIDLAQTKQHPQSVMLILRHGRDLSSVYAHRDDGSRQPLYYRPQDEIVLIYTAARRQVEVLGGSFGSRHDASNAFAELVLDQNISEKPLSEKVYDLSRFATSFELEVPDLAGFDVLAAVVTEIELLLGSYGRRVTLKVTKNDDIDAMSRKYLAGALRFRGPSGIHRIVISVEYRKEGERRSRTLNVTVRGTNGSNVQSHKDRDLREFGAALLDTWRITRRLRPLEKNEVSEMLPDLLRLFDLGDTVVTGLQLAELGLTVHVLLDARLIFEKARQKLSLSENEDDEVIEAEVTDLAAAPGHSARTYTEFRVASAWLAETLSKHLAVELDNFNFRELGPDLYQVGSLVVQDRPATVYLARGLTEFKTINALERELRSHAGAGSGILLGASPEAPRFIGNTVAIPIGEVWASGADAPHLDVERLVERFTSDRMLADRTTQAQVKRGGNNTGSLIVPDKTPLALSTRTQLEFFEKLADAFNSGNPDVHSSVLIEGTSSRSPREMFTGKMRARVFSDFVAKGSGKGFWRLKD